MRPMLKAFAGDSSFISLFRAAQVNPDTRDTFWRTLQAFSLTRIVITVVLLVFISLDKTLKVLPDQQMLGWGTCSAYLALALGFAALTVYARRGFIMQLLSQLVVDIAAISILYVAGGGVKSGLAILYLFPLAGCAILTPLLIALFFASLVTLVLLGESAYQILNFADISPAGAGMYSAAFFATVYLFNRLAARLIKQEALAAQRGHDLQVQEAINRLVIADMEDGVLVVGRDTGILAGNPAAERMLGLAASSGRQYIRLSAFPSLAPIADAFLLWLAQPDGAAEGTPRSSVFVVIKPGEDLSALQAGGSGKETRREAGAAAVSGVGVRLKLRFATVEKSGIGEDRIVIFLQDVSGIENRAQQLKLASMGRLTASIAHEVRNPLSAISHAASLLREDVADPVHTRLLTIVGDNVARLNRMIEDILRLSRKAQTPEAPLALAPFFTDLLTEFTEGNAVRPGMIQLGDMTLYKVRFDPLHLREVVVNLLSNAMRYASGQPGSIRIQMVSDTVSRLELHVQDDGPPITPEVRAHLFEPFYTTSSKGTGLGLYLARELCLNNDAMLDYEYRLDDMAGRGIQDEPSGRFVITFAMPEPRA